MLIFKFYSLCLFNEFLKKKFINLHLSMYTDPGVFSCIIWKKKNESDVSQNKGEKLRLEFC